MVVIWWVLRVKIYDKRVEEKLRKDLDEFSEKYKEKIIIPQEDIVDITDCFLPRSLQKGAFVEYSIKAYVAYGHAFAKKYAKKDGHLVFNNDSRKFLWDLNHLEYIALSCLCVYPVGNTTLYEIYDALKGRKKSKMFQGWSIYQVGRVIATIEKANFVENFNPEKDSAFIFADKANDCDKRMRLFGIWFSQVLDLGGGVLDKINNEEIDLLRFFYPDADNRAFEDVIKYSYKPGTVHHSPGSVCFLYRKLSHLK